MARMQAVLTNRTKSSAWLHGGLMSFRGFARFQPCFGARRSASLGILGVASALMLGACAPVQEDQSGAPGQFRLPMFNELTSRYELQTVKLTTFREPEKLRGDAATILVDPSVEAGALMLKEPIGRFVKEGSVWTPADFATLQATTLYAHAERLLEIDRSLGLKSWMPGPERIAIQSRIVDSPESSFLVFNNAIFDGRLDALFIVPYDRAELPISLNAGVIGHEHFHRIFQSGVLKSGRGLGGMAEHSCAVHTTVLAIKPEVASHLVSAKELNQVVLRSMNEGLADFWGWAYSMDDGFIGRSLGEAEEQARRLDRRALPLLTKEEIRAQLVNRKSDRERTMLAYRFGTYYSRFLRSLVETMVDSGVPRYDAVIEVRRALASSLGSLGEHVSATRGVTSGVTSGAVEGEIEPDFLAAPLARLLLKSSFLRGRTEKLCQRLQELVPPATFSSVSCTPSPAEAEQ